jgi:3-deoxy-7-phosphoheptulonate synthase
MPVGFKNSTAGDLQVAVEAIESARHRHSFLGIDAQGGTAVVRTEGNPLGHLVLRGGADGPNYHPDQLSAAAALMRTAGTRRPAIIVDCSHANSGKKHVRQEGVWQSVLQQRIEGNDTIVGPMVESHLEEGNQKLGKDGTTGLRYGVSITDECVGWETTQRMLRSAHDVLGGKVEKRAA